MDSTEVRVTRSKATTLRSSTTIRKDADTESTTTDLSIADTQSVSEQAIDDQSTQKPQQSDEIKPSRKSTRKTNAVDLNQSLNVENRDLIKTRSRNRLSLCPSLSSMDSDSMPKKRHASNTETSSVVNIETNSNEDSNSNCSSTMSSQTPAVVVTVAPTTAVTTATTTTTPVTRLRSQIITNLNETTTVQSPKPVKKVKKNNGGQVSPTKQQQAIQAEPKTAPAKPDSSVANETQLKCPLHEQCASNGHVNGKFETHLTLDTCPVYFNTTQSECKQRRVELDKSMNELNEKLQRLSDVGKRLRGGSLLLTQAANHTSITSSKEQMDYLKAIDKQRVSQQQPQTPLKQENLDETTEPAQQDQKPMDTSLINDDLLNLKQKQFYIDDLNVPQFDADIFKDVLQLHGDLNEQTTVIDTTSNTKTIQFGDCEIETWYKSPYPDDYWQLPKIYLCEFCLKYMKTSGILLRHAEKCVWKHPPGKEIYRKNNLSFFEVDGKSNKIYCQNLCLLSKLFLDHKTLYFDVEPFLFYILTSYNQHKGTFNMIGYFSKEKHSIMNFNLSCILILPQYMKQGYGKLLIDFSYLLSKIEEKIGSPERPLSDLGLISYRNYWKAKLLFYLNNFIGSDEICIKDLSHDTAIHANDIISTFQFMGLIKYWKGKHVLLKDKELINKYLQKWTDNLQVEESCLKWTPYIINKIDTTNSNSTLLNKLTNLSASLNV